MAKLLNAKESDVSHEAEEMIRECMKLELEFKKQIRTLGGYDREHEDHSRIEAEMGGKLSEINHVLLELDVELAREQKVRKHREMCEERAKEVETKPNRALLASKIEDRRSAIVDIQAQSEATHKRIAEKQAKVAALASDVAAWTSK
jgi:hypothetical protein